MKKVLSSLAALIVVLVMASCCGNKPAEVTVANFKAQAKQYVDKEVVITGVANHICSHSGRKLFLAEEGNDDEIVMVFTNPDMKPFDKETIGKTYTVNGIVKITQTIDNEYLDNWEKEVKEQIAAGEAEEEHCDHEAKAAGIEKAGCDKEAAAENPQIAKIKALREKIAETGEPIVTYHIECTSFEIK